MNVSDEMLRIELILKDQLNKNKAKSLIYDIFGDFNISQDEIEKDPHVNYSIGKNDGLVDKIILNFKSIEGSTKKFNSKTLNFIIFFF